jgi:Asp-tRNA(Asn)/Glu-tRNA(Gln) amidotransferase A subunit family amidase
LGGPSIVDAPLAPVKDVDVQKLRVAVFTDNGIDRVTNDVEKAVRKAAAALASVGVTVEEAKPPQIEKTEQLFYSVVSADGGAWVRRLVERVGTHELSSVIQAFTTQLKPVPAADLTAGVEALDQFRSGLLSFMQKYDAILSPVEAYAAMPDKSMLSREHATTYVLRSTLRGSQRWSSVATRQTKGSQLACK